jgi:2-C-methyl-D-erythritol 4-phosphate cytidylyltransferase
MSSIPRGDSPAPARPAAPRSRCYALVPCAGIGVRAGAGGPKQYAPLAGRPLVAWTLEALAQVAQLEGTLVVLAPGDAQFDALVADGAIGVLGELWVARVGGATRADTVAAGLVELLARGAHARDWVLVHDAARCLVRPAAVQRLIAECRDDEVGGLLALPVADTLKRGDGEGARERVSATVSRQAIWAAQTPQMFRIGMLADALRDAVTRPGLAITDEASAIEAQGRSPRLVRGDFENLKITFPEDFALAERLLRTREAAPITENPT